MAKKLKLKPLNEQVIVITGATSGIGLVTARMAARKGARVIIGARAEDAVRQLESELNSSGGRAIGVTVDVASEDDLRKLAAAALENFGRFDTWVNNAGVSIFGEIMDIPVEQERKLFETNYWGVVLGSRIAVEHLRRSGGSLINLGSVASDRAIPLQAAYSASKHAVKAYTDALRLELEHNEAPVSVTLIKPTAIDTPFFKHAATHMGAQPTEPSPMYAPEAVAEAILHAAVNPVRDLMIGDLAPIQSVMGRVAPRLGDKYMSATMFEGQKSSRQPAPGDNQALDQPSSSGLHERGNYEAYTMERSLYTKTAMNPLLAGAIAVGAGILLSAAFWNSGKVRQRASAPPAS